MKSGNYNAAQVWDQLMFQVAHGKDPVEAFNELLVNYEGSLDGDRWEDLRFPANAVAIAGLSAPPDADPETGLLLFDGVATLETIAVLAQMPHGWKEGSNIRPHIHWRKTTDAVGDLTWTLRYKWFDTTELEGAWSSLINGVIATPDPGATQISNITNFGEIDATGYGISSLFLCQLGRIPTDAGDTYEADALLYEFDIHYQVDGNGSRQEFIK